MIRREVWLLPEPVRTAPTETTGLVLLIWVSLGPMVVNVAPAAWAMAPTDITCW